MKKPKVIYIGSVDSTGIKRATMSLGTLKAMQAYIKHFNETIRYNNRESNKSM